MRVYPAFLFPRLVEFIRIIGLLQPNAGSYGVKAEQAAQRESKQRRTEEQPVTRNTSRLISARQR
jgi:hypothetical protein